MKLLLVEDEKELSKAIVTILELNNYSIDAVYDGEEALDYIDNFSYDGIILDIMLPKVDGLTILKRVREKGIETPIMILSAKSEVDDRCKGLDLGADDYLPKPFSTKELISRIGALIRRKGEIVDSNLSYYDVTLNRSTSELICNNNSVKLNNKEYQLLELLMSSPNIIFSVDRIIDRIWSSDKFTEISTVWVYVSNIRKKLKELGSKVSILSSRNQGYYIGKDND